LHWLLIVQGSPSDENLRQHVIEDWLRYSVDHSVNVTVRFQLNMTEEVQDQSKFKDFVLQTNNRGYLEAELLFNDEEVRCLLQQESKATRDGTSKWVRYSILGSDQIGLVHVTAAPLSIGKNVSQGDKKEDGIEEFEYLSVISDIDDTIKHTNVLDYREMLHNTFFKEFQSVPDIAGVYNGWAANYLERFKDHKQKMISNHRIGLNDDKEGLYDDSMLFHYVSSSPIQLHARLEAFLSSHHFPFHSIGLRRISIIDSTILNLFNSAHKAVLLEQIIREHPNRKYILVGDSNEKDPMIYGDLMRKYPDKIKHIFIRCPPQTKLSSKHAVCSRKYQKFTTGFRELSDHRWHLFTEAGQMNSVDIFE